jgi:hypothetical protein
MASLTTVGDYIAQARILLQDTVQPYRYPDDDLVSGLNMAFNEITRLRPDLLIDRMSTQASTAVTSSVLGWTDYLVVYSAASQATEVVIALAYRNPILFYIVGFAQLRDGEDTQDARASAFINKFTSQLLQAV